MPDDFSLSSTDTIVRSPALNPPSSQSALPRRAESCFNRSRTRSRGGRSLFQGLSPSRSLAVASSRIGGSTEGREHVRKAKRLAAYLNALRPLRLHILRRYLHRGNRYLLARSMSPDPNPAELRPSCFVARSNIPSSAHLLRGRSRSRRRRLASAFPNLMRICRGPSPTREPRPIFRQTL